MIRNSLIVIPFNLPWEWSTDYLNQTAITLSKNNLVICYMWTGALSLKEYLENRKIPRLIKRYSENLYLYYPLYLIPFRRIEFISELNLRFNILFLKILINFFKTRYRIQKKILWVFYPTLVSIAKILGYDYFLIYDCVDYFVVGTTKERKEIEEKQKELLNKSNLVIANSIVLQNYLNKWRKDVCLVHQGFRLDHFESKSSKYPRFKKNKPIIGFVGAVNYRLNYNLLNKLVKANPEWYFVIWGPVLDIELFDKTTQEKMQKLFNLPNVIYGTSNDKEEIPGIIKQFDIAMIPYDSSIDFNKYCYPMKLFEYFYMGKPVLSTPIEELKRFPKLVKIGRNSKEWEKIIKDLLSKSWSKEHKKKQRKLAEENSWEKKINQILTLIPKQ